MIKPMLARVYDDSTKLTVGDTIHLQPKLNGHRCIITQTTEGLRAFSRNGKPITSIQHILDALSSLPVVGTLDGELYIHGVELQDLSSMIRRTQPDSRRLNFVMYDTIAQMRYQQRWKIVKTLADKLDYEPVKCILNTTIKVDDRTNLVVLDYLDRCIEAGYEGAMIRKDDYWYEEGKRSASLYKAKKYLDSEFIVRDITASKDSRGSWAILHCDGFTVSAPGTMQQKIKILENMNEYIGKKLTVKYYGLTKAGIPVFPVALHWRDDL